MVAARDATIESLQARLADQERAWSGRLADSERLADAEATYYREQLAAKDAAILAMKREGFDPPDPRPPTTHEIRAKLDPAILHRIEQIAQPGTKEHYVMLQEAEALVGAYPDRSPELIADEVTEGCPISPYRL